MNKTPLDIAVGQQNVDMCRLLLNAGANVNGLPDQKACPLILATELNNRDIVQLLLDAGADKSRKSKKQWSHEYEQTAFDLAVRERLTEMATLIKNHTTRK